MPSCRHCGTCCKYLVITASGVDYDADWIIGRRGLVRGPFVLLPCRCQYLSSKDHKSCILHGMNRKPKYCQDWPKENYPFLKHLGCKYFEEDERKVV